ncbi:MAG: hypothetical protein CNLJKLNK_00980 [Holosporales bacterium]
MLKRIIIFIVASFYYVFCEDATPVKDDVITLLKAELSQKISAQDFDIKIENWTPSWENDKEKTLSLKDLTLNKNRFQAEIDGFKKAKRINGKIVYKTKVPVLARNIQPGDEILEDDITFVDFDSDDIHIQYISKKEELIGNTSKGGLLKTGVPISKHQIKAPVVIKKGELIRVIYEIKNLRISNKGIAQKDGAKRDTIPVEVINPNDKNVKKVIYATVLNAQDAKVSM